MRAAFPLIILALLIAPALHAQSTPSSETPPGTLKIPNSAEQGKVDRPLREKYKTEFASRDAGERGALARKLRESADTDADPIAKFVYLREARDLSVDAGDFSLAFDVIDDIARFYTIDAEEMKATALAAGVDRARLAPGDLGQAYLKVCDEMLASWNADLASKAAYLAMKESAGNPDLKEQAQRHDKLAKLERHEILLAMTARQKLARNPDDPEQNLVMGRHLCFNMQKWDLGLPFLAKCSSAALKAVAQKDLDGPTDAAGMFALAEQWWKLNDPKANLPPLSARRCAAYWYEKALPMLSADQKAIAQQRLADVPEKKEP